MERSVRNNSYSSNGSSRSNHHVNNYNGKNRSSGGSYNRISPTTETVGGHSNNHHEDLINYIFESWDKVTRDGGNEVKYYQSSPQVTDFKPFDLDALCGRRRVQPVKRQQHNS